jgi:xylulose-5-phosphate/fructose-6-phosphate phosphoketolase
MIFLKDNTLIERKLKSEDIKNRLLGHWGTCPGLVLVYAHINRIVRKTGLDSLYVVGPGNPILSIQTLPYSRYRIRPRRTGYSLLPMARRFSLSLLALVRP